MGKRSDEVTEASERSPHLTEELLSETERLLSDPDPGAGEPSDRSATEREPESVPSESSSSSSSSRLPSVSSLLSLPSAPSPSRYFSPKAFLALVLAVGAGLVAGEVALPFAGRVVGMFAVAFAVGLLGSKRRYLETAAAGVSVGGVTALLTSPFIAIAGPTQAVFAIGVSAGLAACVGGYYFGRDLRDGLFRDVD